MKIWRNSLRIGISCRTSMRGRWDYTSVLRPKYMTDIVRRGLKSAFMTRLSMILQSGAKNAIGSMACMGWKNFGGWVSP